MNEVLQGRRDRKEIPDIAMVSKHLLFFFRKEASVVIWIQLSTRVVDAVSTFIDLRDKIVPL